MAGTVVRLVRAYESEDVVGWLDRHWRAILVAIILTLEAALFAPEIFLNGGRPWMGADPMLFQYSGWYWANGGVPYLQIWDVKPPLVHEVPALLALVTGDNMLALFVVSVGLTIAALIAGVILAGALVEEFTDDGLAALAAGLVVLSYPYMFKQPAWGYRPKAFLVVCGLASFYFILHDRWVLAGAASAAAAGFWQLAIVFPVIAIAGGFRNGRRAALSALSGMFIVTAAVVAPFVLSGPMAVRAMIAEVVVAPLLDPPSQDVLAQALIAPSRLDFALPTALAGGIAAFFAWRSSSRLWWLSAATVWLGFQALYLDPSSKDDLVVGMVVVGIGYGLLAGNVFEWDGLARWRLVLVTAAAIAFVLNVWHAGISLPFIKPQTGALDPGTLEYYYWNTVPPETCHVRHAGDESMFVRILDGDWSADICGQYSLTELLRAI